MSATRTISPKDIQPQSNDRGGVVYLQAPCGYLGAKRRQAVEEQLRLESAPADLAVVPTLIRIWHIDSSVGEAAIASPPFEGDVPDRPTNRTKRPPPAPYAE